MYVGDCCNLVDEAHFVYHFEMANEPLCVFCDNCSILGTLVALLRVQCPRRESVLLLLLFASRNAMKDVIVVVLAYKRNAILGAYI